MQLLDAPLAIVDLETTGANASCDRITEIAVIEVDGGEVSGEWSTLVDPETTIPPAIQALTGISNDMVAGAPTFGQLARDLHERLAGRVVVAHNARFDYGFLRQAFERVGIRYVARTLCTVKLSRRLYPGHGRHNLDSLIARHELHCRARHRALGDADAVWQFLRVAASEHGAEALALAARQVAKQPTLPPHIDRAAIDAVPDAPGAYLFYGEGDAPLYVGKSISMRSRVLAHFADDLRSAREMQLAREVRRIDWQRTAGELGALLREAELVKELAPVFNRQLRRASDLCGFVQEGASLRLARADEIDAEAVPQLHGVFRSKRAALAALRGLADEHGLCLQTLGFDRVRGGRGACFRHQIRRCAGVCAGRESVEAHRARVAAALARLRTVAWPYRGAVGVVEDDRERDTTDVHVVHNWCYLGTVKSETELADLLESGSRPRFDLDQYKILARHLLKGHPRVVELPA
jgi:DNA polymerase III subunit epsilon